MPEIIFPYKLIDFVSFTPSSFSFEHFSWRAINHSHSVKLSFVIRLASLFTAIGTVSFGLFKECIAVFASAFFTEKHNYPPK